MIEDSLPTVSVLLSTYNGEGYIREQLDSILSQRDVELCLLIRDDGSSDGTKDILKEYDEKYGNITVILGDNIGVGHSFMSLLNNASETDYYSFSDQDDVWLEDKLSYAIKQLGRESIPTLYASNQILFDISGNRVGMRFEQNPPHDLEEVLIRQNWLSGCTMVFNKPLREILSNPDFQPSERILNTKIHDAWTVLVANVVGKIIYDPGSRILYRQHENNVVGIKYDRKLIGFFYIKDKLFRLASKKYKGIRSYCAKKLLNYFGSQMNSQQRSVLETVSACTSFSGGIQLYKNREVRRYFKENDIVLWMKILLGWI